MKGLMFIGDEVSAAGYRLAGAAIRTPAPGEVDGVFRAAREEADALFVTAEAARHIDAGQLAEAQAAVSPLVIVVPDIQGREPVPDLEAYFLQVLGLDL